MANYLKAEPCSLASGVIRRLESHAILPELKSLNPLHSRGEPGKHVRPVDSQPHPQKRRGLYWSPFPRTQEAVGRHSANHPR